MAWGFLGAKPRDPRCEVDDLLTVVFPLDRLLPS
jgi:hypothetical protein